MRGASARRAITALLRDVRGASAVEFALVSMPLIFLLLLILQMGLFYMTQSSLDAGVVQAADSLVNEFYTGATPTIPTDAQLRALVVAKSGGLIHNDTTLLVDLRLFATLSATVLPVTNTVDPSTAGSILALRAQASVPVFLPGFSSVANVRSAALIRRQNY